MTRLGLLYGLKKFCESKTETLKLPTAVQKGDEEETERAPEVHIMRLPTSSAAKKYAPYILLQFQA